MFKDFLRSVDGIATYPIIALIIFFTTFVGVLIYVLLMDKRHIERMVQLPFEDIANSLNKGGENGKGDK